MLRRPPAELKEFLTEYDEYPIYGQAMNYVDLDGALVRGTGNNQYTGDHYFLKYIYFVLNISSVSAAVEPWFWVRFSLLRFYGYADTTSQAPFTPLGTTDIQYVMGKWETKTGRFRIVFDRKFQLARSTEAQGAPLNKMIRKMVRVNKEIYKSTSNVTRKNAYVMALAVETNTSTPVAICVANGYIQLRYHDS